MSLFYQFGSKHLFRQEIMSHLRPMVAQVQEYREPFVGAGAVALDVLAAYPALPVWLSDIDPPVVALWRATRIHRRRLIERIRAFTPHVDSFRAFKLHIEAWQESRSLPKTTETLIELGFHQLAVARMRWSGMGVGPRGGYDQHRNRIGERWRVNYITKNLTAISRRMDHTRITMDDFSAAILDTSRTATIFLDPPYVKQSQPSPYAFPLTLSDHARLAALLRETPHQWFLTYHDHPLVRELYGNWAKIITLSGDSWTGWRGSKRQEAATLGIMKNQYYPKC